jgi:spore germination cell wall hydrolase CwlJ-like protein
LYRVLEHPLVSTLRLLPAIITLVPLLAGCALLSPFASLSPRQCMTRVMYFESNRSSEEGMLAVGTVVMNRLADPKFPKSVCAVVGQKNQFADGVLWKPMKEKRSMARAAQVAEAVLSGQRHPGVRQAKFFHTAGLRFPYNNMHYVLEAGGNEFYEKY